MQQQIPFTTYLTPLVKFKRSSWEDVRRILVVRGGRGSVRGVAKTLQANPAKIWGMLMDKEGNEVECRVLKCRRTYSSVWKLYNINSISNCLMVLRNG